jgi:hypothetical protein
MNAFIKTLRHCLLNPRDFFEKPSMDHASRRAWLYALIVGSIGSIFSFIWASALIRPLLASFPVLDDFGVNKAISTASLIFTPLIITLKVVFSALYFQFLLFLTRSARQNTSATFRIVCYAQSTAIFELIPVFGSIISPLWSLYLLAVGFNKIHKISMFRAYLIILLPLMFLLAAVLALAVFFSAGILFHDVLKGSLPLFR